MNLLADMLTMRRHWASAEELGIWACEVAVRAEIRHLDTLWGVFCDDCKKGFTTKEDSLTDAVCGDECIHEKARPAKLQFLSQSGPAAVLFEVQSRQAAFAPTVLRVDSLSETDEHIKG